MRCLQDRLVLMSMAALHFLAWAAVCFGMRCPSNAADSPVQVERLRVEYRRNPLGVDVTRPRFFWVLESERRGVRQTAWQILVASSRSLLDRNRGDVWDSGKVDSDRSTHVVYDGPDLQSATRYYWKVRVWDERARPSDWSRGAYWVTGFLHSSDWSAKWIGGSWRGDWQQGAPGPLPWLRKTFRLDAIPQEAFFFVAAMGNFELYINGKRVGDAVLEPAVSHFPARVLSIAHDVTEYLAPGENCVALWLGQGWNIPGFPGVVHDGPIVLAQAELRFADGRKSVWRTDETWKAFPSPSTPILGGTQFRTIGERYDARREIPGWNEAGLDVSGWNPVKVFSPSPKNISAQLVEPNRRQEAIHTLEAVQIEALPNDVFRIDMGRNFSGWLELDVRGEPGQKLTLEYLDQLAPAGRFVSYRQVDEYVFRGNETETFSNRFNYHGFRWVVLRGLDRAPGREDVRGFMVHSDFESAGSFGSSNPLLDQIFQVTRWTQKALSLGGYSVDCPHRERLGYGAEGQATMEEALYNFDLGAFYTKWLTDWRDVQDPETGELPHTAPAPLGFRTGGGPGWGGIIVTLPWQLYLQYGDLRILEQCYPAITRWLAFLESHTEDGILQPYGTNPDWHFLGDWNPPGRGMAPGDRVDDASTLFFNNCYFLYNLEVAAKIASALGNGEDASGLGRKVAEGREAIHRRFYRGERLYYGNGEQTYLAFPLLVGLVPEPLRPEVLKRLETDLVRSRQGHLDSGVLGTYFWLKYLTGIDRSDLIYLAATQRTFPGWGYMLERGATTFWEQWDGDNSRIHSSYLSIGSWFFEGLAGIRPDPEDPGFRVIEVRPPSIEGLDYVKAQYDSIQGRIRSEWRRSGGTFRLRVRIPANTRGIIRLPTIDSDSVTESGRPAREAEGVTGIRFADAQTIVEVGSGTYLFSVPLP